MARLKPSRASAPSAAKGPEMSLAIPTLMVSAEAMAGIRTAAARREGRKRMVELLALARGRDIVISAFGWVGECCGNARDATT